MDQTRRIGIDAGTDWDLAFHLYKKLIACGSEAAQVRATLELARLSRWAPETMLACLVPILVELLPGSHESVQEAAAYCLYRFARRDDGSICPTIRQSETIPSVLKLLPQSEDGLQRRLVKCLRAIVVFDSASRVVVARIGGLEVVLDLIPLCTENTKRYLLEILGALAMLREVRRVIVGFGGLPFLVEAASCGKIVSRTRAAHAIGFLGTARRFRHMLVDLGVIPILVSLFQDGDAQAKLTAGNALGIISSHVDYLRQVAQAGAIPLYAELLEGPEPLGKEIAEDVFCILAVVEDNAVSISRHLVRILQEGNEEAKAAAADVLWDLSSYKHSVSVVRESGAIPLLLELLREGSGDVREKALGAIAQLSYEEHDRRAMAEVGAIPLLIDLLRGDSEELKDNAAEALINYSEDPLLRERVSEVLGIPSFQIMQDRIVRIRASDEHMVRSMRRMGIEQFTLDPDLT